jgi:flagellar biosynthesis anti-sigma factor FlgM
MKIDGLEPLGGMDRSDGKSELELRETHRKTTEEPLQGDTVQVGSEGEAARLRAEIEKIPEIRFERVEALQNAVTKGTYHIPAEDIAAAIIEELV